MNAPLVLVERNEPFVTVLSLNRPEKRNALSIELIKQICAVIKKTATDPTQRILMIRGAGDVFCAGLDLQEASQKNQIKRSAAMVAQLLLTVSQTPLISIAVVHGAAVAGGAGLMSACDLVVASDDAKMGYPETRRGLVAALVTIFLRRQLRERDMRELLLTGELISASRALEIGLVNRVVSKNDLMKEAWALARTILQGGPQALIQTKQQLNASWPSAIQKDLNRALKHHLKVRQSKEAEEGIRAFLEKRSPEWGR